MEYADRRQDRRFENDDMVVDAEAAGIQPLTAQGLDNPKRLFVVFDQTEEQPAVLRAVERLLRIDGH